MALESHTHTHRAAYILQKHLNSVCTHIDAYLMHYSPTNTELSPKVQSQTEFMDLAASGETAQLPLIQGLHGQIVVSPAFPPHTPKLESAYRVKNMFFFQRNSAYFQEDIIFSCQMLAKGPKPQSWMDRWDVRE